MQHGKQMKCKAFYCKKQIVGVFSGNAQQAGFINASVNVCMIAFFLKQSTLKMKMLLQFSDEMVLSMFFFFCIVCFIVDGFKLVKRVIIKSY